MDIYSTATKRQFFHKTVTSEIHVHKMLAFKMFLYVWCIFLKCFTVFYRLRFTPCIVVVFVISVYRLIYYYKTESVFSINVGMYMCIDCA